MNTTGQEEVIWEARPSHWIKFGAYSTCVLLIAVCVYLYFSLNSLLAGSGIPADMVEYGRIAVLVIAVASALKICWIWINLRYTRYTLTSKTLYTRANWLAGKHDTLWVHLIRDIRAETPLHLRLIGLGRVVVISLDRTDPDLILNGLRRPQELKLRLNEMARVQGATHGTRVVDTGG